MSSSVNKYINTNSTGYYYANSTNFGLNANISDSSLFNQGETLEDVIVNKLIERLTGEGSLSIVLDLIMSKLTEYMESEDNKELIGDFIEQKMKSSLNRIDVKISQVNVEIDKLKNDVEVLKEQLGFNKCGYDNNYYLGSISNRLQSLENRSSRLEIESEQMRELYNTCTERINVLLSNKSSL